VQKTAYKLQESQPVTNTDSSPRPSSSILPTNISLPTYAPLPPTRETRFYLRASTSRTSITAVHHDLLPCTSHIEVGLPELQVTTEVVSIPKSIFAYTCIFVLDACYQVEIGSKLRVKVEKWGTVQGIRRFIGPYALLTVQVHREEMRSSNVQVDEEHWLVEAFRVRKTAAQRYQSFVAVLRDGNFTAKPIPTALTCLPAMP
jgi:hypothetical protein